MLLVETERLLGHFRLHGRPYLIYIDPVNYCNLHCPLCPTGSGTLQRLRGMMSLEEFRSYVDSVAPFAYEITLTNWGEPLLNPSLFDLVRYARSKNLSTNLSSNLNRLNPEEADSLLTCGLEYLIISMDGATQESYARYRVGGRLNTVIANTRHLIQRRRDLGLSSPMIRWQFIMMKHNEHEIGAARNLAREVGVDQIRFITVGIPFEASNKDELAQAWFPDNPAYRPFDPAYPPAAGRRGIRCPFLFRSLTVNPGGGVSPCCIVYDERYDFGNLLKENLETLWNNDQFQSARRCQTGNNDSRPETVCQRCLLYDRRPGFLTGLRGLFSR